MDLFSSLLWIIIIKALWWQSVWEYSSAFCAVIRNFLYFTLLNSPMTFNTCYYLFSQLNSIFFFPRSLCRLTFTRAANFHPLNFCSLSIFIAYFFFSVATISSVVRQKLQNGMLWLQRCEEKIASWFTILPRWIESFACNHHFFPPCFPIEHFI